MHQKDVLDGRGRVARLTNTLYLSTPKACRRYRQTPGNCRQKVCNSTCLYPQQAPRALGYSVKAIIATRKARRPCLLEGSTFLTPNARGSSDFEKQKNSLFLPCPPATSGGGLNVCAACTVHSSSYYECQSEVENKKKQKREAC